MIAIANYTFDPTPIGIISSPKPTDSEVSKI